jgi:hypothetical protein
MNFESLPAEISHSILEFLDFREICLSKEISKYMLEMITEHPRLFQELLEREIPDFQALKALKSQYCEEKMRRWTKKEMKWCVVGNTADCSARYLHRSAPIADVRFKLVPTRCNHFSGWLLIFWRPI